MKPDLAGVCALVPDRLPPEGLGVDGLDSDPGELIIVDPDPDLLLPDFEEDSLLLEQLARARATLERERAEAPALCESLLDLPPAAQAERVESDPLLHIWGVGEALLERSLATEEADPEECARLAQLALRAAAHLDPEPPRPPRGQGHGGAGLGLRRPEPSPHRGPPGSGRGSP